MRSAWQGRSVFITGHTGFKGSWLALRLAQAGARVHGYALAPDTTPSLFDVARVSEDLAGSTFADIRDRARLAEAFARAAPEIVFHLAAQPLVRRSYREPFETWDVNLLGTVAVLDTVRRLGGVAGIVVVTSDKCYAQDRSLDRPFREGDPLGGHDPYSASKAAAEIAAASYRDAFFRDAGVALATARAGNVIGGGDWAEDRLVPDVARAAYEGKTLAIRYPDAIRPWQHVLDAVDGYERLGARMLAGEGAEVARAWNFGPPTRDVAPVRDVVAAASVVFGLSGDFEAAEAGYVESAVLLLDSRAAETDLGWASRLPLSAAVAWTAQWYRAYYEGADAAALTRRQLAEHEALDA